jgi:hypothetical protein
MGKNSAILAGELARWPSKAQMASILSAAGLTVNVGRYSIRVRDCSDFAFQEYGGDLGEPTIEASASSPEALTREAKLVSDALARANLKHRFEIYDWDESRDRYELSGYLHHGWPSDDEA